MPLTEQARYTFSDSDNYRTTQLTSLLSEELKFDMNARMSLITSENSDYPLFTEKLFDFFSTAASSKYSDRTMMQLRRWGKRFDGTTPDERRNSSDANMANYPAGFVVESPFGWNPDTEIKHGGILGMYVMLPTDEGEYRGVLAVPASFRRRGIASALLNSESHYWHSRVALFAHSNNFAAAGLAAKCNLSAIQINSQSQVVQYQRVV